MGIVIQDREIRKLQVSKSVRISELNNIEHNVLCLRNFVCIINKEEVL